MSLKRKLLMVGAAIALPLSTGLFVLGASGVASAGAPKYDNSTDTVTCGSIVGAKFQIEPALNAGTTDSTTPTVIKVSGKFYGCTDGNGALSAKDNPLAPDFEGVFSSGSTPLAGHGTSVLQLSGCSSASGTITISWLATDTSEVYTQGTATLTATNVPLLYSKTYLNTAQAFGGTFVPSDSPYGTNNLNTDGYGSFMIGTDATPAGGVGGTCTHGTTETTPDAFEGLDGGTGGSFFGTTQQDFSVFLENQEDNSSLTVSNVGLANGVAYLG